MNKTHKKSLSQIDLAQIARTHDKKGAPTQNFNIHIDSNGKWFHQGIEIKRKSLVKLFASVLTKLDDDCYWLITPAERGKITVQDAPFYVNNIEIKKNAPNQKIILKTSLDEEITLGKKHLIRIEYDTQNPNKGPRPYVNIRGRLDALIARSVYYQLADIAQQKDEQFFVISDGIHIIIS